MSAPGLRVADEGAVVRLTLDRPPLNVLTTAMMNGLAEALEAASVDPGRRVVRIDAEGRAFSAGVDVGEHRGEALGPMMDALARLFGLPVQRGYLVQEVIPGSPAGLAGLNSPW